MGRQEGGRGLNNIVASFQRGGIINKMQIVLFLLELLLQWDFTTENLQQFLDSSIIGNMNIKEMPYVNVHIPVEVIQGMDYNSVDTTAVYPSSCTAMLCVGCCLGNTFCNVRHNIYRSIVVRDQFPVEICIYMNSYDL